jgi:hypothetical protein
VFDALFYPLNAEEGKPHSSTLSIANVVRNNASDYANPLDVAKLNKH